MKTRLLLMTLVCAVALPFAFAQDDAEKTLTGEPVDIACYLQGRSGEGHIACAKSCADKGQPIGLAVKEGDEVKLYLVLGAGGKAAKDIMGEHMGKQVKVTGKVSAKEGLMVIAAAAVEGA